MRERGFRVELDGLVVVGERPLIVALVRKRGGAVVVGGGVLAVEPDDLIEVGDGAVEIAAAPPGEAAVGHCGGEVGIELERQVVVGDGAGEVALGLVDRGAAHHMRYDLWLDPHSLAEVGDGAIVVAPGEVGVAAVHIGADVIGVDAQRRVEVGDGPVVVAGLAAGDAAVGMQDRQVLPGEALAVDQRGAGGGLRIRRDAGLAGAALLVGHLCRLLSAGSGGGHRRHCNREHEWLQTRKHLRILPLRLSPDHNLDVADHDPIL